MELEQRLIGLDNLDAITVTHLLFRYLTHRLDEGAFRRLFVAEESSTDRERAYNVALASIHDIEAREGVTIQYFSEETLNYYLKKVAELSRGLPSRMNPSLRDRAERELELIRAM